MKPAIADTSQAEVEGGSQEKDALSDTALLVRMADV